MQSSVEAGRSDADRAFFGHPRGLGWLSGTEFWERFSYYGMQALLVLYLTHQLLKPGHIERVLGFGPFRGLLEGMYGPLSTVGLSSAIFGLYTGLVWMMPILGGVVADRITGRTPAIVAGGLLMAAGHFLMAFDQSFLIALACLLIGVGLFKGNLASQVSGLYASGDPRAAGAFQIYLLGIQIAVIVTPLVCGTLGELLGWHWGFGAAGIGMVTGLAIYLRGRRWLPPEQPRRQASEPRTPFTRRELGALGILIGLLPPLAVVQIASTQVGNAYVVWGEASYDLSLLGMRVPVTWLQTLDAIFSGSSIVLSLLFWRWWAKRRPEPNEMTKLATGGVLLALAPLVLAAASWWAAASGHRANLGWAVLFELVLNLGWANVGPVSLALYARLAPRSMSGTVIGICYLSIFLSSLVIGWLGGLIDKMSGVNFWLLHAGIAGAAAVILLIVQGPVGRLLEPDAPRIDEAGLLAPA